MSTIKPAPTIPTYAKFAVEAAFTGKDLVTTKNLDSVTSDASHVFYTFSGDLSSSGTCIITTFQTITKTLNEWVNYFETNSAYINYYNNCNIATTISEFCDAVLAAGGPSKPSIVSNIVSFFMSVAAPEDYNAIGKELTQAYNNGYARTKLMTVVQNAHAGIYSNGTTTWYHWYTD